MKSIHIQRDNLAEAWEDSVKACWEQGEKIRTQYDRENDPPSCDCTMLLHVNHPLAEPRYHRGLCMGLNDLEKYVQEVLWGIHDHWMNDASNPNRWTYTYHQRLFDYNGLNQIDKCIQMLKDCPYSRRAQAVTWQNWIDLDHADPPCLQSVWFRILENRLTMNVRFRSNDLFKAAFPNMVALTELHALVAQKVGVEVGDYLHLSDSMHIYGKDFNELQGFLALLAKRTFGQRTWTGAQAASYFVDGCNALLNEADMPEDKKVLIMERRKYWEHLGGGIPSSG